MDDKDQVTALLSTAGGDPGSAEELVRVLYDELRGMARGLMSNEKVGHTLQPTALVNELYLKLIDQSKVVPDDRAHFLGFAAHAMRQILVNHARKKSAQKRGGGRVKQELHSHVAELPDRAVDLLALDDALERLLALKSRVARGVEMRYFGGMTVDEVATALEISPRTAADDWEFARAWLARDLGKGAASS